MKLLRGPDRLGMPSAPRRLFMAGCGMVAVGGMAFLRKDSQRVTTLAVAEFPRGDDLAPAETRQAAELGTLCSSRNAAGVGLRGEYFARERLTGAVLSARTDRVVDFDATLDWAGDAFKPRSVRWSGWVKAPLSGSYRFHCDHPGARVVVGKTEFHQGGLETPVGVRMATGRFYPVTVELDRIHALAGKRIRLEWTPPHGVRFLVAQAVLFLPMA